MSNAQPRTELSAEEREKLLERKAALTQELKISEPPVGKSIDERDLPRIQKRQEIEWIDLQLANGTATQNAGVVHGNPSVENAKRVFKRFLEALSGFTFDQSLEQFLEFAKERMESAVKPLKPGALTPTATLLMCASYHKSVKSSPPEFRLISRVFANTTQASLDDLISKELSHTRTSNVAAMTDEMVAVLAKARDIAERTTRDKSAKIAPRHFFGSLLDWLLNSSTASEKALFTNFAFDLSTAAETFLSLVLEELKYPDDPDEWGRFFVPFTMTPTLSSSAGSPTTAEGIGRTGARAVSAARLEQEFEALLKGHNWSQSLHDVFQSLLSRLKPIWEKGRVAQLTPENVMLGLLQHGLNHLNDPADSAGKLASISELTPEDLDDLLTEAKWLRVGEPTNALVTLIDPRLRVIVERAERLAQTVSKTQLISVRHLVAALLLPLPPSAKPGTACHLPADVFPAARFTEALIENVRTASQISLSDYLDKWQSVLRDLQAGLNSSANSNATQSDSDDKLARAIDDAIHSQPSNLNVGSRFRMPRIAREDEMALQVKEYAEILKDFFIATKDDGELCFALYGHWGRGKSFLMDLVAKGLQLERYTPVHFSAWKYPNAPEVWVHLYETLADEACNSNVFLSTPRIIRAGIAEKGPWPLLWALTLFAVGLSPKIYSLEKGALWVMAIGSLVGLGGLIWLVELLLGVAETKKRLSKDFLTATRHTEKLGLQATIGKDLKALLNGWIPQGGVTIKAVAATIFYTAIVCLVTWCTWHWFGFGPPFTNPHPTLQLWTTIGVAALGALLFVWVISRIGHPRRVLLIVDDLDRCAPTQLLSVMESVKMLLDDSEINKRVQVAMLIEEHVLNHALKIKYGKLGLDEGRMLRENKEKLFNVQLRLSALSDKDLEELMEKIIGKKRALKIAEAQARLREMEEARKRQGTKTTVFPKREEPATTYRAMEVREPGQTKTERLTDEEEAVRQNQLDQEEKKLQEFLGRASRTEVASSQVPASSSESTVSLSDFDFDQSDEPALRACIPRLRSGKSGPTFGPRSIRAFLFRYQLARLFLIRLKIHWTPTELADELVTALTGRESEATTESSEELKRIVAQVT